MGYMLSLVHLAVRCSWLDLVARRPLHTIQIDCVCLPAMLCLLLDTGGYVGSGRTESDCELAPVRIMIRCWPIVYTRGSDAKGNFAS